MGVFIHPTAIVEEPAKIGSGTKVWHFSHVMAGAEIGAECILGQNVFVASTAKVGRNVKIQNNVSVYDGVELEADVFCGPSVTFTNVTNPRSFISRRKEFKKTLVQRGASVGANATILCGLTIGCYSFVGAGSVVTRDVPNYGLVYGIPATLKGWICRCGTKLKKQGRKWICPDCGGGYTAGKGGIMAALRPEP